MQPEGREEERRRTRGGRRAAKDESNQLLSEQELEVLIVHVLVWAVFFTSCLMGLPSDSFFPLVFLFVFVIFPQYETWKSELCASVRSWADELVECQFGVLFAREQQQPSEGASTEESSAAEPKRNHRNRNKNRSVSPSLSLGSGFSSSTGASASEETSRQASKS